MPGSLKSLVLVLLMPAVCCIAHTKPRGATAPRTAPNPLGSVPITGISLDPGENRGGRKGGGGTSREQQQQAAAQLCHHDTSWSALYANIPHSFRFWSPPSDPPFVQGSPDHLVQGSVVGTPGAAPQTPSISAHHNASSSWGITAEVVDAAVNEHDSRWSWRRIAVLFEGGQPYIISNPKWPKEAGHHRMLAAAHVLLMVGLSRLYGTAIPDVELVIGTSDEPTIRLDEVHMHGDRPLPLLRFCGSKHHADVLVPDIHFHMRGFTRNVLSLANRSEAKLPSWSNRTRRLFGRFASYHRLHHPGDDSTYRKGFKGERICTFPPFNATAFCTVRTSFMGWAERMRVHAGVRLDVAAQPRRPMPHHAQYRYLLHLDGQTCSSRLEQLLALGSMTIKEESGYHAFYHHLLKPYVHYVPFWKQVPEEILDVIDWAKSHDKESQDVAAAGQQLALNYLNNQALRCYWLRVIQQYASLQRYKPGLSGGRKYRWRVPAEEWLSKGQGATTVRNWKISVEV